MDNPIPSSPVVPDGPNRTRSAWRGGFTGRYEWISPSPSPAVVAELERLFPEVIQVPTQALEEEEARWLSNSIIVRSLFRWIPPEVISKEFQRGGLPGEIEAIALANKHFIFRFSDPRAVELALARPWVANGQPLAVALWQPDFVPSASSLLHALLWIRLPQLPIEYWTDEALSLILSAAGEFLFADSSTKDRSRGGFARACVRVDLSLPLRPGARIRGSRVPFWQQFSYENLEGICGSCGALHFDGCCGVQPEASSSSSPSAEPRFGSWMAALRRKKPSSNPLHGVGIPPPGFSNSASPVPAQDAWAVPRKLARSAQGSRGVGNLGMEKLKYLPVATVPACRFPNSSVPVGATDEELPINPNPFACLASEGDAVGDHVGIKPNETGQLGQTKRARPIESTQKYRAPRSSKGKGKALQGGKSKASDHFKFAATADSLQGSNGPYGSGTKKSRRRDGPSGLTQAGGLDHDMAVSLIKKALQRDDSAVIRAIPQNDSQSMEDCFDKGPSGTPSASNLMDQERSGDMVAVPSLQGSE